MRTAIILSAILAGACTVPEPIVCRPDGVSQSSLVIGGEDFTGDVVATEVSEGPGGLPSLEIQFSDDGKARFLEVTRAYLDRELPVSVDGEIVSSPMVREPIAQGRAVITGALDLQQVQALSIKLAPACPDSD